MFVRTNTVTIYFITTLSAIFYLFKFFFDRISLIEMNSGQLLNEYSGHSHKSFKIETSFENGDGRLVCVDEEGSICHWNLLAKDGLPSLRTLRAHSKVIIVRECCRLFHLTMWPFQAGSSISYHPNKDIFVTGSYDGTAKVWESKGVNTV